MGLGVGPVAPCASGTTRGPLAHALPHFPAGRPGLVSPVLPPPKDDRRRCWRRVQPPSPRKGADQPDGPTECYSHPAEPTRAQEPSPCPSTSSLSRPI